MKESQKYIDCYTHNGQIGVMAEFAFSDPFTPHLEEFRTFIRNVTLHIAAAAPNNVDELLEQHLAQDESVRVVTYFEETASALGEILEIRRFIRWDVNPTPEIAPPPEPESPVAAQKVI